MNYQKLILVGNAIDDAQSRKSKKGDHSFTTFGIAVIDVNGRTTFFPVTVFGKFGLMVKKYVTKGCRVLLEGRIGVCQSGRFYVIADQLQLGHSVTASTKKSK